MACRIAPNASKCQFILSSPHSSVICRAPQALNEKRQITDEWGELNPNWHLEAFELVHSTRRFGLPME
jgi:hypothetical protein